jgi:hypothetical protein
MQKLPLPKDGPGFSTKKKHGAKMSQKATELIHSPYISELIEVRKKKISNVHWEFKKEEPGVSERAI